MPKADKYPHGTPCWVDLATADLAGARAFYAGLFGWEYEDEEMAEMGIGVYSMAMLEGSAAAAIYEASPRQMRPDRSAKWNLYVSVENVDDVVGRVAANGGAVLAGSRDVDRAGRVAVIADPTDCVVTLWEPGEFTGCGVMSEAGAFSMVGASEHGSCGIGRVLREGCRSRNRDGGRGTAGAVLKRTGGRQGCERDHADARPDD